MWRPPSKTWPLYTASKASTHWRSRFAGARWLSKRRRLADHPDVAALLSNLAAMYEAQGQYTLAEPLYKRSLAIWEKALGPDHPNVATALENLAMLYEKLGQKDMAAKLASRAKRIRATNL